MGRKRTACALVVLSLLLLAGCANIDKRTKCIAGSAAIGVAIGAGSGAIIGSQISRGFGDNYGDEGLLAGAAAGGLIGSIVGAIVCDSDADTDEDGGVDEKAAHTFGDTMLNHWAGCDIRGHNPKEGFIHGVQRRQDSHLL